MPDTPTPGSAVDAAAQAATLRHGAFEDAQALFAGTLFVAMALMLFNQAGLLVGGTAGVAFLLHYVTGISFGKLFFVVNLPFYWFAWTRMGASSPSRPLCVWHCCRCSPNCSRT